MPFYIGDIVHLKSETKEMTIIFIDNQNFNQVPQANCVWLDKDYKLSQAWFPLISLTKKI